MFIYSIAFVFYAIDLANRSGDTKAALTSAGASGQVSGNGSASSTLDAASGSANSSASGGVLTLEKPASAAKTGAKSRALRIGFSLTILGFLFHLVATVLRAVGAGRVPFANMYEFALTATLAIVAIFILMQFFVDVRFLGVLITGMAVLFLGVTKVNFYVEIVPLPPALDSYWLVIHILVAVLSVGFFTLSFGAEYASGQETRGPERWRGQWQGRQ